MNRSQEIIFTFPPCLGGVASFNFNIINNSALIKNFYSKIIFLQEDSDDRALFLDHFNVDEQITFHYSDKENQFYVQKRLNKLLGSNFGCIVTDNALTIQAARRFNNLKTVFHLIHDYYYVNQNVRMGNLADICISHSSFFRDAVFASNPAFFEGRSFYVPYGVKQLSEFPIKKHGDLNLVFLGRLAESKGVQLLYEINKGLKKNNVSVNWTIIGKGPLQENLQKQWAGIKNIRFYGPDTYDQVYSILQSQDIFIFPTTFEGTPVSILESLANGVVTIVNDLPGGIQDIIVEGIGYRCSINMIDEFVQHITKLYFDRTLLREMQKKCFELAKSYDIEKNADNYFKLFFQYQKFKRLDKGKAASLNKLDKAIFPNWLVKFIRKLK
jgi:glycosyltransferase involved in cell wall biosynthesis